MDAFNSVKSGLGSFFSGVCNAAGGIWDGVGSVANGIGDMFSSGTQPASGMPDASGAQLAQGATEVPNVSGGASPSLSSSTFGGGIGDVKNALSQTIGDNGASSFDWGSLVKQALPIAQIGYSLWRGSQEPDEIGSIRGIADAANQNSTTLNANAQNALMGRLPGGAQASIDQALEAARARIRSNYASLGMTGSTPEAQDLAYAELAASAQAFQIGQGMATTGLNAAAGQDTLAATLYQAILGSETARGTALGDALAEFAAGLVDDKVVLGGGT